MAVKILNSLQMKEWDLFTMENEPIKSIDLMERAALKCTDYILSKYAPKEVSIFCGIGNNGGDGLVIARVLHNLNVHVNLFILEFSNLYANDFQINLNLLPNGINPVIINEEKQLNSLPKSELIIDAIFGSGCTREISLIWMKTLVGIINGSEQNTISIDCPSGLFSYDNRKNTLNAIVEADETLTFQSPKLPFLFARYEKFYGKIKVLDIGLHKDFTINSSISLVSLDEIELKIKSKFTHKGTSGHLLLIGGFEKMYGAITLTTKAAYKSGCGYVYVKMDKEGHQVLLSNVLEAVLIEDVDLVKDKLKAIAIGPGLGRSEEAQELLNSMIETNLPLVIDADAINILADNKNTLKNLSKNSILSPHVKELERLIGKVNSEEEFLEKQIEFSIKYKVYVIQKGAYSKLSCPNGKVYVNSTGNEGMAIAGMGDVLTGVIGSMLAQGYSPFQSALYGMLIHGRAGDLLKNKYGNIGMLPSELINYLPQVFAEL